MVHWQNIDHHRKRIWKFFWYEDSLASWIANVIVAFLVIRFIVYPVLGLILGTSFPIVAVVSESMEHGPHDGLLCGGEVPEFKESFKNYWSICGPWYEQQGITANQFQQFSFPNGFDKGDVIILWRAHEQNLEIGDVLVFQGNKPQPIIHRIVSIRTEDGKRVYQTKGDHNYNSIGVGLQEKDITEERIFGKGVIRLPYLGWLKILFVDSVRPLGINIQR